MNEVRDYAKECGTRCRQIRMAKGISQQQLAEKMNVTAAAISKWEKEGVSNIDHIMRLSDVLGQDITADQMDQEGAVGEVGKEILRTIVEHKGKIDISDLCGCLYGMKQDRINNELFKLERIGTVIREQFTDCAGTDQDVLFITAKGIIVYKNYSGRESDSLWEVTSIENILSDGATSIQEHIDNDIITAFLRNDVKCDTAFRFDYLYWMYRHYYNTVVRVKRMPGNIEDFTDEYSLQWTKVLTGHNCFIDIMRRMAQSGTREKVEKLLGWETKYMNDEFFEQDEQDKYSITGLDENALNAMTVFGNIYMDMSIESSEDTSEEGKVLSDIERRTRVYQYELHSEFGRNERAFYKSLSENQRNNVLKWFSYDEIYSFIEKNILPAQNDYERMIQGKLSKIWEYNKSTLNYYYEFPEQWENNGLAQFIRERVGIPNRNNR